MSDIIVNGSEGSPFKGIPCNSCKWNFGDLKCYAFPEGIPREIYLGYSNHSEPLESQDNDIVFEPISSDNPQD